MITRCPWPSYDAAYASDPFVEPDHFDMQSAWSDYLAFTDGAAPMTRNDLIHTTHAAREAIRHAWHTGDSPALPQLVERLRLDHARDYSDRHYPKGSEPVHETELVRLAADLEPGIGNDAPDRLLGPWATLARMPRDARLLQVAMAAGAFMRVEEQAFTPRRMWSRRKPQPDTELRGQVRAVAHAPYTVWPIEAVGPLWRLGPGVGADAHREVHVRNPALLPGQGPAIAGHTLAARVVHTPTGWHARVPIVIAMPVPTAAESWLDLLLLEHRLTDRRAGPRDVLRGTGHVLVRRVLEAAWLE